MTGGGPINSTMTIVQLIYQTAFSDFNYGRASAQALILLPSSRPPRSSSSKFLSTDI